MTLETKSNHGVAFAVPLGCLNTTVLANKARRTLMSRTLTSRTTEINVRYSTFSSNNLRKSNYHRSLLEARRHHVTASVEPLILTEENVNLALGEVKEMLGSMFGNNAENLQVGITGDVELASVDGPIVVLRLKGRFWHKRSDVLARVSAYLMERIPEICETEIEDVQQLDDADQKKK